MRDRTILILYFFIVVIGHVTYQFMQDSPDYLVAVERTYFGYLSAVVFYFYYISQRKAK